MNQAAMCMLTFPAHSAVATVVRTTAERLRWRSEERFDLQALGRRRRLALFGGRRRRRRRRRRWCDVRKTHLVVVGVVIGVTHEAGDPADAADATGFRRRGRDVEVRRLRGLGTRRAAARAAALVALISAVHGSEMRKDNQGTDQRGT